jgi:alcohol oxidase
MMYTRASASDYDDWEKVHENPGWGSNDLIPLLRKVFTHIGLALLYTYSVRLSALPAALQTETYQVPDVGPTHGTDGPLKVSPGAQVTDFGEQFLQIARALDPTRAKLPPDTDSNDLSTINVYTVGLLVFLSIQGPNECIQLLGRPINLTRSEMAQVRHGSP